MFAGTSTGALIAGSLAAGISVTELIRLYEERRSEIFSRRFFGFLHPVVTKYSKDGLRRVLWEYFGDRRLADLNHDVLITAVDTVRSETTYFSCFRLPPAAGEPCYGTYRQVRLRDAIEASASAPTYFPAHGRFIDGGTTIYNNPAYVAAVEALRYSSDKKRQPPQPSRFDGARVEVYSFGTGTQAQAMEPYEAVKKSGLGWIKYVIGESSDQAGIQQSYVAQSELELALKAIAFYRYDVYLTAEHIEWAVPGSRVDPASLSLDAVDDERFEILSELGKKVGQRVFPPGWTAKMEAGIPTVGDTATDVEIVRRQERAGEWIRLGKPKLPDDYVQQVLDQFDQIDEDRD